jgi:CMP-N-acetylneuraminic acid synthetase
MYNGKKILAIIPARGGSKGLPGKNIKILDGKPLIGWTIEQAKCSKYIDEIFVSTDSREIADTALLFGVEVPELRPIELAADNSPSSDFVLYTIDYYEKQGRFFDYIILLEPTSPLRKKGDIDNMISLLKENPNATGVVSFGMVHTEHPSIVKKMSGDNKFIPYVEDNKVVRRQDLSEAYFPYGVGYLVEKSHFIETKQFYSSSFVPYFIERWQNYEIDDIYDFICIESILKYKKEEII